jgi:hypothetical protein
MKEPFVEGSKDSSRRRSQRLLLQVTVFIRGVDKAREFTEETRTLVVNAHGGLLTLTTSVERGQSLHMKNKATGEEQACKVAFAGTPTDGVAQVGLEFIEAHPDFWRIAFPPEDWASTASAKRTG